MLKLVEEREQPVKLTVCIKCTLNKAKTLYHTNSQLSISLYYTKYKLNFYQNNEKFNSTITLSPLQVITKWLALCGDPDIFST